MFPRCYQTPSEPKSTRLPFTRGSTLKASFRYCPLAYRTYETGRITPQTNCLLIRPVFYTDRAINCKMNKTENRPLSCQKKTENRPLSSFIIMPMDLPTWVS